MEGLHADTLATIQKTAVDASSADGKVVFKKIQGEPEHVYAAIKADGSYQRIASEPVPRHHQLSALFEAISFVNSKGSDKSVIWFNENNLTVIVDDETRRDFAILTFTYGPQFAILAQMDTGGQRFKQAAFRRLLRVDFHGARPNDLLLDWISACEFGNKGNASGMIAKDKSSFGREIEQQVTSRDKGECPDEITFTMPVFADPGLREDRAVTCDVEILLAEESFLLTPFPGQVQAAIDAELTNIEALMTGPNGVKCPVFRGQP
jgi:hypothetical protein